MHEAMPALPSQPAGQRCGELGDAAGVPAEAGVDSLKRSTIRWDFPNGISSGMTEALSYHAAHQPQETPFSLNEVGTELLPFHDPLKPGAELRVAPGASEPL